MSNWTTEKYKANDLINQIINKNIKVPHYQRGQVWKTSQKEKLIDSIKNGFPFGTILLYKKEDNTYQLIDGLQRTSTIYEYLNTPAKFFRESDLSKEAIDKIYNLLGIRSSNKKIVKEKIVGYIKEWVILNHHTMNDVKNINSLKCAQYLQTKFPTCTTEAILSISNILHEEFIAFKEECEDLSDAEIPAIVYSGNPDNLPEVFNRINSKGTTLSKYQILSATWSTYEYCLLNSELDEIIKYVDHFYTSILDDNFEVDGYDSIKIHQTKKLNLYQILFGFSKLLSNRFPYLFANVKSDKDVESCGFNLVNACLGNKNSKISHLPVILKETFSDDQSISQFFANIIKSTNSVYKLLKPYLEFKLNKRESKINIYHTEFQICSMIANYFNMKYATYTFDDNNKIIGRNIKIIGSNETFHEYKKAFKNNAFKKYLIDIMNNHWTGSGDTRMDEVSVNRHYYTDEISIKTMEDELDHWFNQMNANRHESKNVASPKSSEKIMLCVIYCHSFSAFEQNDDINYDIEHLAPKGRLKILLKKLPQRENQQYGLPISSFGNICLLREEINRKKKDKTLYQDTNYLTVLKTKNISLEEIEYKFTFTNKKDLEWINEEYNDFNELRREYYKFLEKRFQYQKNCILKNLYNDYDEKYYTIFFQNQNQHTNVFHQLEKNSSISKNIPLTLSYSEDESIDLKNVISRFDGWQKAILDIIMDFDEDIFSLTQVYQFNDKLSESFPNNHHIDSKIRQVLQTLRDYGFIEFLGNGQYKKLINVKNEKISFS